MTRARTVRLTAALVGLVVFSAIPFIATAAGYATVVDVATCILIYAIAAVSLDLIIGYGAMVSFGHAMFFSLGGYPRRTATREEILMFLEGKIAKWWMPDDVVFVEEFPHSATGSKSKAHRPSN